VISTRWSMPWVIVVVVAIVIAALDQLTKQLATNTIGPGTGREPISIIPGVLQLRYVENTGAAFGILQDNTQILALVSFGVIALLVLIFGSMISRSLLLGFAFGLQFGGATGNLIDRIRLGYVVDFIDVPHWPTFNVADSGITVGVIILAFVLLFKPGWVAAPRTSPGSSGESSASTGSVPGSSGSYENRPAASRDTDQ
jgi:signal peptidase II